MFTSNLDLNKDTSVFGTIESSNVMQPYESNSSDIYSVTIRPHDSGLCQSLGLLFNANMGPNSLNSDEVAESFIQAQTLTFETIIKPMTSGADGDDGEFVYGQNVKVSCRFEMTEPVTASIEEGFFMHPRLMLRFVDTDFEPEVNGAEKPLVFSVSDSQQACYDF